MRPYSPGGILIAFAAAQKGSIPSTPSIHRLRPGLPGYLIPFAPLAFASQRQLQSSKSPSPLVFLPISTHFTATLGIPFASPALKLDSSNRSAGVEPLHFTFGLSCRLHALYAQLFRTTLATYVLPRLLARSLPWLPSQVPSCFVPVDRALRSENLLHSRGVAPSGFRPLRNIPYCCLP